jgi:amino acid adenylation domain-containing protein
MVLPVTLAQQLDYWRENLPHKPPPLLDSFLDFPRPPVQSFIRDRDRLAIEADAVMAFCEREKLPVLTVLATGLAVLLNRYTGSQDFVLGMISTDSKLPDHTTFVNPVPVPVTVSEDITVSEFFDTINYSFDLARLHKDIPFNHLVAETGGDSPDFAPVCQVILTLLNTPAGISADQLREVSEYTVRCDLVFTVEIDDNRINIECEYDTMLFKPETISRLLKHWAVILQAFMSDIQTPVGAVPLLTATEREQLLTRWNDTRVDFPRNRSVQQIFETQVVETPNAVALCFQDEELSYSRLNAQANQLAHHLIRAGIQSDDCVGVFIERSPEMIIGIIAVLKAGAVYVPLDPDYPMERIRGMLSDSRSTVILSQQHLAHRLPEDNHWTVICLDREWPVVAHEPVTNPGITRQATDLAYVMFTSGSTGRPKGIQIRHRAIIRLVRGANFATLTAEQVFLQLAPVSFDAATLEIWGALLNGARLVLMPPQPPTLAELAQAIVHNHISVLWLTAGLFHQMVEAHPEALATVRQLLAGGDVLQVDSVERMLAEMPFGHRLVNGYGPTENTTFTCCYPMTPGQEIEKMVPIGRPISNTQIYILNKFLQPVPVGVPGELFIGGDGLAQGYVGQPRMTAQHFVPDPFSESPGERLYKTGDLARWREDGVVEFLGRSDSQLKIRGFRVEPGEIEFVLSHCPGVVRALVQPFLHNNDQRLLVAYLLLDGSAATIQNPKQKIYNYLEEHLPEYMIPAAIEIVQDFPLTPNGKVDRSMLPLPEIGRQEIEARFVQARTPVELVLTDIWQELLAIKQIGVLDNFFALGGHSLLATRLINRIQKIFRMELSLSLFFEAPTIAALADSLIRNEPKTGQVETAARLYMQIREMTPHEVQAMIRKNQT